MSVLEVHNVSIRYITGDFKNIGLKEYVMRKLTKRYHIKEFWADREITFSLEKGDMLGIVGSNGAGKSTLLKVISGIMEPTCGKVVRRGKIAALLNLGSGFDGEMTVKENTYLRGAMLGYTREFMDRTYDEIIRFAELEEFQDRLFRQLSSGMKSRLAFSIASRVSPDILILDEVLGVGDGAFRKKSEAKMRELLNSGATTILVSHGLGQIRELCNKVLWLEKGRQIAFGNAEIICDLYQQFLDRTVTLDRARAAWEALNRHYDYLIVGAGLYGSVFARQVTERGKKCLVIDRRPHLGGNVYCEKVDGITVHRYGPHIFHTDSEDAWNYVNRYAEFKAFDGGFGEEYQGIPEGGYNGLIEKLLESIPTVTSLSCEKLKAAFPDIADKVVYTGAIDAFFDYRLGYLDYRGLRFETEILDREDYQGQAVVESRSGDEPYTRSIEYKHFLKETSPKTVVMREIPQDWAPGQEACYPVDDERNRTLYGQYRELAQEVPEIIFAGRLGEYKYRTMAETVAAAIDRAEKEL